MTDTHPPYETAPLVVKICGLTREEDIRWAIECGADFVGVVLCQSPRQVHPDQAAKLVAAAKEGQSRARVMAVAQDPSDAEVRQLGKIGFDGLQLHGEENPERVRALRDMDESLWVWKAIAVADETDLERIGEYGSGVILLDSRVEGMAGGTGTRIELPVEQLHAAARATRLVLAGGLDPKSVIDAVVDVEPWGVDVSSGVEVSPGQKDPDKVKSFIENAKAAARLRALAHRQHHEPGRGSP
jgi:phosphoribosylanthranilate isomerase